MRATLLAALCCLMPLAACGDDDEGKVVSGNGYEVTVPEGWDDESDRGGEFEAGGFSPELVLIGEHEDDFTTNVNVISTESPAVGLDAQVRAERQVLERGGAPGVDSELEPAVDLSPVERTTLDGSDARAYEIELPQGDRVVRARQVVARNDGSAYAITFTTLPDRFDSELDSFKAILDSWRWR